MVSASPVAVQWKRYPFVRLLPVIIAGILISKQFTGSEDPAWMAAVCAILAAALTGCSSRVRNRWIRSLFLGCGLAAAAAMLFIIKDHEALPPMAEERVYNGISIIAAPLQERARTWKTCIDFPAADGMLRCQVYIRKDSTSGTLEPGDLIRTRVAYSPPGLPDLPGQFDYGEYLRRRGITATAFIDNTDWSPAGSIDRGYSIIRIAGRCRSHLESIFDSSLSPETAALIKAMVLGIRDDLDAEVRQAFTRAGIMHILAVSGLHVSIVWMLAHFLCRPVSRVFPRSKPVVIGMEVILIWSFAILSGLGPAVQRAAFMFSLLALSRLTALKGQAVNLTSASAAILLLIRPNLLFEAGFQLSYAAVFGILLLYSKFNGITTFQHPVLKYCWSLQAVSFAAVIATAPVSIFYFHQFPVLFPIANLLAVPGAFLLVAGGLLLIALHGAAVVGPLLGKAVDLTAKILMDGAAAISSVPGSSIQKLYLDVPEAVMLAVTIASMTAAAYRKLQFTALCLLPVIVLFIYHGTAAILEIRSTEFYELPPTREWETDGLRLLNIGRQQFLIHDTDQKDRPYLRLDGNHRFDRIRSVDTLYLSGSETDRIKDLLLRSDQASSGWPHKRDRVRRR